MNLQPLKLLTIFGLIALVNTNIQAQELKTETQKVSYTIGQQIGSGLKSQKMEIDIDVLTMSIKDAITGAKPKLTQEEMMAAMMGLQQKMQAEQAKEGEENKAAALKFLKENKTKKGVKETSSGLQYMVIKEGDGAQPKATDKVKVHYKGTLLDGSEFDSSYKRNQPAEFPLNGVIKGWTEGIPLMKVGSKFKFFIPPQLAYGPTGRPSIPANSLLIFEVELLEVVK